jgi:hypothetical protein
VENSSGTGVLLFASDCLLHDAQQPSERFGFEETSSSPNSSIVGPSAGFLGFSRRLTSSNPPRCQKFGGKLTWPVIRILLDTINRLPDYGLPFLPPDWILSTEEAAAFLGDVEYNLEEFLLFLKSVSSIVLHNGKLLLAKAELVPDKENDKHALRTALRDISILGHGGSIDLCYFFNVVKTGSKSQQTTSRWCICHHMQQFNTTINGCGSLGWIGLAARISTDRDSLFLGKIFDPLPTLLTTGQPVHIFVGDLSDQSSVDLPKDLEFNFIVLEKLLPQAWSILLLNIGAQLAQLIVIGNAVQWERCYFSYWPSCDSTMKYRLPAISEDICRNIFSHILSQNCPLFPAGEGSSMIQDVFVCRLIDNRIRKIVGPQHFVRIDRLYNGFLELKLPITFLPDNIYSIVKNLCPNIRTLSPVAVSMILTQKIRQLEQASSFTKQALLEYLLSKALNEKFDHIIGLPVIPTCDGKWRSLQYLTPLKLPANQEEVMLFDQDPKRTVDIRQLSTSTISRLWFLQATKFTGLQPWHIEDMIAYVSKHFENITIDSVYVHASALSPEFPVFVQRLWGWIMENIDDSRVFHHLKDFWVVPLVGNMYQKPLLATTLDPSNTFFGKFLLGNKDNFNGCSIFNCSLGPSVANFLKHQGILLDSGNLGHVLQWLRHSNEVVSSLSVSVKEELCQQLVQLASSCELGHDGPIATYTELIRGLEIFQEVRNAMDGIVMNKTSLSRAATYIAVDMELAVPEPATADVIFINANSRSIRDLLGEFQLAELPDNNILISRYVIPTMMAGGVPNVVERLGVHVLEHFSCLTKHEIELLSNISFIAAKTKDGLLKRLIPPRNCVDFRSDISCLFFSTECVWVEKTLIDRYREPLKSLGMIQSISIELVLNRIACYSSMDGAISMEEIWSKTEALIKASLGMESIASMNLKEGKWLPARTCEGNILLQNPHKCRDIGFVSIIGLAVDILPLHVGPYWSQALGWLEPILPEYIKAQIEELVVIDNQDGLKVVMEYMSGSSERVLCYVNILKSFPWIPAESDRFFRPEDIFFDDFTELEPYCSTVKSSFTQHIPFLGMVGVTKQPSFEKLENMLKHVGSGVEPLGDQVLAIAIRIAIVVTRLYPDRDYRDLLIPDWQGILCVSKDLVADSPHLYGSGVRFIHPSVPKKLVKLLRIPYLETERSSTVSISIPEMPLPIQKRNGTPQNENLFCESLNQCRAEESFNVLLAFFDSLEGNSSLEWRLKHGKEIGLFIITDTGKYFDTEYSSMSG